MKAVYSSGKLVSSRQLKYLLVVAFLVAMAFGSDNIEPLSGTAERIISYDDFIRLEQQVKTLLTQRATFELTGGVVYTRWGRNVCSYESDVVYNGVAAGSWYDSFGGGRSYICLSLDPIWAVYDESVNKLSKLYGSEYHYPTSFGLENNNGQPLQDHNVPCVVCQSQTRTSVVMIPGRSQCYSGWHTEYNGYLVSAQTGKNSSTEFICMDGSPEALPGGDANEDGALFCQVEGVCGSLPCPPYVSKREITCVVCSK